MNALKEIYNLCHGIGYSRDIPKEAEEIAKANNIIVIVGGSDDLMYCYGSKSYLTEECEHPYGWDGEDFSDIEDDKLLNIVIDDSKEAANMTEVSDSIHKKIKNI